jgi:hypothetical protein
MKRQLISLIVFVSTLCPTVAFSQSDKDFEHRILISDFVNKGTGVSVYTSDTAIRALGRVNKIDVKLQEAYYDKNVVEEERTYYLDGLQIVANFVKGQDKSGYISKAIVTGPKWKIDKGLRVGTSKDVVIKTLGEPTSKSEKTYEYCGETSVDCAVFEISTNKVVKITFTYYWD